MLTVMKTVYAMAIRRPCSGRHGQFTPLFLLAFTGTGKQSRSEYSNVAQDLTFAGLFHLKEAYIRHPSLCDVALEWWLASMVEPSTAKRPSEPKKVNSVHQSADAVVKPTSDFLSTEKERRWSPEDCERLLKGKNEGKSYWEISKSMPNHTPEQCHNKWKNSKGHPTVKVPGPHSHWSANEDSVLFSSRIKRETWDEIRAKIPGRSLAACRKRFHTMQRDRETKFKQRSSNEDEDDAEDSVEYDEVDEEDETVGREETGAQSTKEEILMDNEADADGD